MTGERRSEQQPAVRGTRKGRSIAVITLTLLGSSLVLGAKEHAPRSPLPLVTGCFADNCAFEWRDNVIPGRMIDADTWESAPVESAEWLPYEGNVAYGFFPPFGGRIPYEVTVYLSTNPNPLGTDNIFSAASGNLAQLRSLPDFISVHNGTCADYYMRVVAKAAPWPPPPPEEPVDTDAAPDGGADPDAAIDTTPDASEPVGP